MITTSYLKDQFLIAMPAMDDPNFSRTVTYICEHNDDGAMGLVVNRPLQLTLGELLNHLDIAVNDSELAAIPLYAGGPVEQERGFVLHAPLGDWDATLQVGEDIGITTSRDILQAIAEHRGPQRMLVMLGYAGWQGGQIEREMVANAWLSGPASRDVLFDMPSSARWQAAADLLGVDLSLISSDAGHA